jgi:hypothetical protein
MDSSQKAPGSVARGVDQGENWPRELMPNGKSKRTPKWTPNVVSKMYFGDSPASVSSSNPFFFQKFLLPTLFPTPEQVPSRGPGITPPLFDTQKPLTILQ